MRPETLAVHAGMGLDPVTGALAPSIHLSTTYERDEDGGYAKGFSYTRENNPTRQAFETALAALEGGEACLAFSSGMAAICALFQAQGLGAKIVVPDDMYFGNRQFLEGTPLGRSFQICSVDMTNLAALEQACSPAPRLVWVETPSNPLVKVVDLVAVAAIARVAGARLACDNTWATPLLQRPLVLGFDYVVHSVTKYLSGHHDAMSGAVVARNADEQFATLKTIQVSQGAVPSPFDMWLALRGLQTLPARMQAHERGAARVAEYLSGHAGVVRVHYPGLEHDPGHSIAKKQMTGYGAMMSIEVPNGRDGAFAVANDLKLFTRATSLGGTHSLVEHRASVEGPASTAPAGLLRLSIGLEHPDDLIEDLCQALKSPGNAF